MHKGLWTSLGLRTNGNVQEPELLKAVEHLARNETEVGIKMLAEQGRITELANPRERVEAIARDYAAHPENTIIVSPDNRGPLQINDAVRAELLRTGALAEDGQTLSTLAHRSDMTGADRTWLRGTPSATYFNTPPAAGPKESSGQLRYRPIG